MTIGKASALTLSLAAMFALGVWAGPLLSARASSPTTLENASATPAPEAAAVRPASGVKSEPAPVKTAAAEPTLPKVSPQMPELLDRLQPLLNRGADMTLASEGFRDAELFASVAHAAKNTEVPFVLLKHRVLREGKTLNMAIAELKPTVNAQIEATRARAEARSDIASLVAL